MLLLTVALCWLLTAAPVSSADVSLGAWRSISSSWFGFNPCMRVAKLGPWRECISCCSVLIAALLREVPVGHCGQLLVLAVGEPVQVAKRQPDRPTIQQSKHAA